MTGGHYVNDIIFGIIFGIASLYVGVHVGYIFSYKILQLYIFIMKKLNLG